MFRFSRIALGTVFLIVLLAGCRTGPRRATAIGEAFVGPATLKIRSDIPLESSTVTTVKHGDRLEILQRKRRFLRVRTPSGAEGWTDERQLLSSSDMQYLRDLAARAAKLPSQGQATTFGDLNVHTQPARQSPSFLQVKEKQKVDVLLDLTTARATDVQRAPLIPPPPKKQKSVQKKGPAKEPKYPPPPMPKPPPAPKDWIELSRTNLPEDDDQPEEEPAKPIPMDEWSLVRVPGGQSGWVLTRRLLMAIPDEVAQYAEGHRIVSYFSLGKTEDEGVKKDTWLWTTATGRPEDHDFDSFRVFIWSLRRHRYETAYIERNLRGFAPVLLREVDYTIAGKTAKYPGFSICTEKADGRRMRRDYAFLGNIVRSAGEQPCEAPVDVNSLKPQVAPTGSQTAATAEPAPEPPKEPLTKRLKDGIKSLFRKKK